MRRGVRLGFVHKTGSSPGKFNIDWGGARLVTWGIPPYPAADLSGAARRSPSANADGKCAVPACR